MDRHKPFQKSSTRHISVALMLVVVFLILGIVAQVSLPEDAGYSANWFTVFSFLLVILNVVGAVALRTGHVHSRTLWGVVVIFLSCNIMVSVVSAINGVISSIACNLFAPSGGGEDGGGCKTNLLTYAMLYFMLSVSGLILSCFMFCRSKFKRQRAKTIARLEMHRKATGMDLEQPRFSDQVDNRFPSYSKSIKMSRESNAARSTGSSVKGLPPSGLTTDSAN